jgi:hypothetical protein
MIPYKDILDILRNVSAEDITAAYRARVAKMNPPDESTYFNVVTTAICCAEGAASRDLANIPHAIKSPYAAKTIGIESKDAVTIVLFDFADSARCHRSYRTRNEGEKKRRLPITNKIPYCGEPSIRAALRMTRIPL